MNKLSARLAPILFGLMLSGLMSLIVSGVATFRAIGLVSDFGLIWLTAWAPSWSVAFPTVLVVAPFVRRMVAKVCMPPV